MARDTVKGDILDSVNDRLAERFSTRSVTGILWCVRAIGKRRLDRLDQDIGTVIGRRAVDIDRAINSVVLINEGLGGRVLRRIDDRNSAKHGTLWNADGGGIGRGYDTISATQRSTRQAGNLLHLLANQDAAR